MTRSLISTLAILSLLSATGAAQTPSQPGAAPAPEPRFKGPTFQMSSWAAWPGPPLFVKIDEKTHLEVKLAEFSLSETFPYKREQGVILFEKIAQEGKDPIFQPKFQVPVPPEVKSPLIMMVPGKDKPVPRLFEMDPADFPPGAYRFVNLSAIPVLAGINSTTATVPPNGEKILNLSPKDDQRVRITGTVMGQDGKPITLFSSMAINRPTKRMMMFFFPSPTAPGSNTLACRSLVDFVQPPGTP